MNEFQLRETLLAYQPAAVGRFSAVAPSSVGGGT
jgi:hypothetical protein